MVLLQIAFSFLFLGGIEPFFGRQFSMWHSRNLFSSIFDLGPLNPKIYSPKFGTKIAYESACMANWQIDWRSLGLLGGFWGWPIHGTMQNVLEPTLVAMATTFALGVETNRLPACLLISFSMQ